MQVATPRTQSNRIAPRVLSLALLSLAVAFIAGCASTPKVHDMGTASSTVIDSTKLELIEKVAPEYPEATKAARIEGRVDVKYRVNPNGSVSEASVVKSAGPSLDRFALAAVSKWKYKPYSANSGPFYLQTSVVFKVGQ